MYIEFSLWMWIIFLLVLDSVSSLALRSILLASQANSFNLGSFSFRLYYRSCCLPILSRFNNAPFHQLCTTTNYRWRKLDPNNNLNWLRNLQNSPTFPYRPNCSLFLRVFPFRFFFCTSLWCAAHKNTMRKLFKTTWDSWHLRNGEKNEPQTTISTINSIVGVCIMHA